MGRYLVWYKMQLKAWMKQRICLLQLIGMVVLVWLLSNISFPKTEMNLIGICNIQGEAAEEIFNDLKERESVFEFCEYKTSEELRGDLLKGKIKAGFEFCEDFQYRWDKGEVEESVQYIVIPYGTIGILAKETFFSSFFKVYSQQLLLQQQGELYHQKDVERTEYLLEKNQKYLQGDDLFQIQVETVSVDESKVLNLADSIPLQGIIGIFIFVVIWMEQGRKKFTGKQSLELVLNWSQKNLYEYVHCVAVGTPMALEGLIMVLMNSASRGILKEIGGLLLLLFWCSLWTMAVIKIFRRSTIFASWTMVLVMIQLVICPVFADISMYIPANKYIRYIFPVNIYLQI